MEARDGLGRGIVMHAARGNHAQTFEEVLRQYKEITSGMTQGPHATALTDAELLLEADIMGMNCLHHAAETGCPGVLQIVFSICKQAEGALYEETYKPDKTGRTPIMLVLRNNSRCDKSKLKAKFDMLYNALPNEPGGHGRKGWMALTPVPSQPAPPKGEGIKTRAVTELMHAARGGLASLELALNKARGDSDPTVDLDEALAVEVTVSREDGTHGESQTSTHDPKVWGRALLLAAAAKLGEVDVLYHILGAIEVGRKRMGGVVRFNLQCDWGCVLVMLSVLCHNRGWFSITMKCLPGRTFDATVYHTARVVSNCCCSSYGKQKMAKMKQETIFGINRNYDWSCCVFVHVVTTGRDVHV